MKRFLIVAFLLILPSVAAAFDLESQVTEFSLANGMKWLLVRRAQAPVFSGVVMVRVGGADEEVGKTGLAHMFEHIAFKGSPRLGTKDYAKEKPLLDEIEAVGAKLTEAQKSTTPDAALIAELSAKLDALEKEADKYRVKNEIWEILVRNGAADLNAYTSKDVTAYHASMPINRLKLWARVTSEMIFAPTYREFYTERKVVAEERRSGVDNNPDGAMSEKILSASFTEGPYRWSTVGYEKDVLGLTIADARAFHEKHYVPSNMVGVLVGDLNIAAAKKIIQEEFGKYEKRPAPPGPAGEEGPRGNILEKMKFRAEPSISIAYHKPTLPDPSEYTFDVINALLCDGMSSRLEKRLVYEKRMAEGLSCTVSYPGSRLPTLFLIWIDPLKPNAPRALLKEVSEEMAKLRNEPVGEEELSRVRKLTAASFVFALEQNMELAQGLAEFQTDFGNWRLLASYPKMVSAVSADDVMRVAKKYLSDDNRIVVERERSGK